MEIKFRFLYFHYILIEIKKPGNFRITITGISRDHLSPKNFAPDLELELARLVKASWKKFTKSLLRFSLCFYSKFLWPNLGKKLFFRPGHVCEGIFGAKFSFNNLSINIFKAKLIYFVYSKNKICQKCLSSIKITFKSRQN